MRSNSKANPDDIDIVSLWGAVRRGLPRLMIFTIGAGVVTFAALSTMASRFASEAQLAIVAKSTNPFPDGREKTSGNDSVTPRMDKEAINTQVRALLSTDLLLKVANKLKLGELAEFNPRVGDVDLFSKVTRMAGLAKIPGTVKRSTIPYSAMWRSNSRSPRPRKAAPSTSALRRLTRRLRPPSPTVWQKTIALR